MTLASEARAAVRRRPFLRSALAAGVVNYSAAARYLDVGEEEAVAAALRRYADELTDPEVRSADPRVDMRSGFDAVDAPDGDALLTVGDTAFVPGNGDRTAVIATGDLSGRHLAHVLARLDAEGISVTAAGGCGGSLVCLVDRRDGVDALRYVEDALEG
jgi:hypothetical protein